MNKARIYYIVVRYDIINLVSRIECKFTIYNIYILSILLVQ